MTPGDSLWTGQDSGPRIHIGSSAIRLAADTDISFLNLDDQTVQIQLPGGSLDVRLRHLSQGNVFEIDTPNASVSLVVPARTASIYRTRGHPRHGAAGRGGSHRRQPGLRRRYGAIRHRAPSQPCRLLDSGCGTIGRLGRMVRRPRRNRGHDRFDEVCSRRCRRRRRPGPLRNLDDDRRLRADVAAERRGLGLGSVQRGYWAWVEPWGWTWIDYSPWGFAPFHYGRWVHADDHWGWIPGKAVPKMRPV